MLLVRAEKLQEQAMALKTEQEEKVAILAGQENILKEAAQIEVSFTAVSRLCCHLRVSCIFLLQLYR